MHSGGELRFWVELGCKRQCICKRKDIFQVET